MSSFRPSTEILRLNFGLIKQCRLNLQDHLLCWQRVVGRGLKKHRHLSRGQSGRLPCSLLRRKVALLVVDPGDVTDCRAVSILPQERAPVLQPQILGKFSCIKHTLRDSHRCVQSRGQRNCKQNLCLFDQRHLPVTPRNGDTIVSKPGNGNGTSSTCALGAR